MGIENTRRFEVLPNPTNGEFKIIVNKISDSEILSLTIIDVKGNVVYNNANFTTQNFDFGQYAKGIYMVQLNSSVGYKNSKRVSLVD